MASWCLRRHAAPLTLIAATLVSVFWKVHAAFVPCGMKYARKRQLSMAKGFNSAKGKQAEMARKMALAKKQQGKAPNDQMALSDEEQRLKDDRAKFEKLLAQSRVQNRVFNEMAERAPRKNRRVSAKAESTSPNKRQVKPPKRTTGKPLQTDDGNNEEVGNLSLPLQVGDTARRYDFESLICLETSKPLGPIGAAQLVPWVPPYVSDYIVILADPRTRSGDLRQSARYLTSNLEPTILDQVIIVNADPVKETKSWISRTELKTPIRMFSDQNWEWMRSYSAVVSDGRWALSIMVICNSGRIRKCFQEVDPSKASQLVMEAVASVAGE